MVLIVRENSDYEHKRKAEDLTAIFSSGFNSRLCHQASSVPKLSSKSPQHHLQD